MKLKGARRPAWDRCGVLYVVEARIAIQVKGDRSSSGGKDESILAFCFEDCFIL